VCGLDQVSEHFTLKCKILSEFLTKVSERDAQFDFYEQMFMFARQVTHRKYAAGFFLSDREVGRVHAGDYTASETEFAVPLADAGNYFLGREMRVGGG
jgi:hypothetical protein